MKPILLTLLVLATLFFCFVEGRGSKKYNNIMEITKDWDGHKPKRVRNPDVKTDYVVGMEVNTADVIDLRNKVDEGKGSAAMKGGEGKQAVPSKTKVIKKYAKKDGLKVESSSRIPVNEKSWSAHLYRLFKEPKRDPTP
jgi:hypothetical protein